MSQNDFPQSALLPPQASVAGMGAAPSNGAMPERMVLLKALKRLVSMESEGFITEHLREILDLPPELSRIDQISFACDITAAAAAITQPATVRLNPDYQHELFAIIGYVNQPATDPGLPTLCNFNLREQGRNFDIWTTNSPMAMYVGPGGSYGMIEYPRGAYVFRSGADVQCRFQVPNAAAYIAAATIDKTWGITLLTNMVRKD